MNIISKYEQKEIVIFLDEKINQNNEDKLFSELPRPKERGFLKKAI